MASTTGVLRCRQFSRRGISYLRFSSGSSDKKSGGDKKSDKNDKKSGNKKGGEEKNEALSSKIGINGFQSLGQMIAKLALDKNIEIGAINETKLKPEMMAFLFKNNTSVDATVTDNCITIKGKQIPIFREKPNSVPWSTVGVEYVVETTGEFRCKEELACLLRCGGKKIILASPMEGVPSVVHGLNTECYNSQDTMVSAGSPVMFSLGPLTALLHECFEIAEGGITTIGKQIESPKGKGAHRLAKNGPHIIPSETSVADMLHKVFPPLEGKLKTLAVQVPISENVLMNILTYRFCKNAPINEVKCKLCKAADGPLKGVLEYVDDEVTSKDFINTTATSILDSSICLPLGPNTVQLITWSDTNSSFANGVVEMMSGVMTKDYCEAKKEQEKKAQQQKDCEAMKKEQEKKEQEKKEQEKKDKEKKDKEKKEKGDACK